MKAIPLWQPWASLVAVGAKRVETRHWPTPPALVGQRVAIHATKTPAWLHMCMEEPFNEYLPDAQALPLGAIVATVVIDRCSQITYELALELESRRWHEFAFGNYEPGRYAWVLRDVEQLATPVPFTGRQGIFDVPDHLLGAATRQGALL